MKDMLLDSSDASIVLAVLEGGPATIPDTSRIQSVSPLQEKIKVPHYGGYEHFVRTSGLDENGSSRHIVYRWATRTEMAE
jgi:hypothetical protein